MESETQVGTLEVAESPHAVRVLLHHRLSFPYHLSILVRDLRRPVFVQMHGLGSSQPSRKVQVFGCQRCMWRVHGPPGTLFPRGAHEGCARALHVSVLGWSIPSCLLLGVESGFLSSVRGILAHIAATNASFAAQNRFLRRQG